MITSRGALAKKYAQAFLNNYLHEFTPDYLRRVQDLARYLNKNSIFQATLSIPSIPLTQKQEFIEKLSKKLSLRPCTKKLVLVLLVQGRIDLIDKVLEKILLLHEELSQEKHFLITTSHQLSDQEKQQLIQYLQKKISEKISTSFEIDQSLICGYRIQSNSLLMEHSIAKQLRILRQNISRQEGL